MKRRELYSLIGSAAAGVVASAAAVGVYACLTRYSVICERDIAGTTIVVWCAAAVRVLMWLEKKGVIKA